MIGEQTTEQETSVEEEISDETEVVSEKAEEVKPITFATQEELDTHIEPIVKTRAQGMKDKELSPLQTRISDLQKELNTTKTERDEKREDSAHDALQAKYNTEYGEETTLPEFKVASREVLENGRKNKKETERLTTLESTLNADASELDAYRQALTFLLPEDEDILAKALTLKDELLSVGKGEERRLLLENRKLKVSLEEAQKPKKTARTKPDKSVSAPAVTEDKTKLTPQERINKGVKDLFKEE